MFHSLKTPIICVTCLCFLTLPAQYILASTIVPDGQTNTHIKTNGLTTDISTSTVTGQTGLNSFKYFDVKKGQTTNLHLPSGTENLLNLVHNKRSTIDGVLNAYKDGSIGGNVFFLNPYGVVVGASGTVNVGSLTAITPTRDFMKSFFDAPDSPQAGVVDQVLEGRVPLNSTGLISVKGEVNALNNVRLMAGDVQVSGQVQANLNQQPVALSQIINVEGVQSANKVVFENGAIEIIAADDVTVTGKLSIDGSDHVNAGDISITAGDQITVKKEALISARGQGENSNAGDIIIFADDDAKIDDNALIDARGGGISGDGGFLEFSAKDRVDIDGGEMLASATNGKSGHVLIDPTILNLDIDIFTSGADMTFEADERINVNGVTISSRQIAGADHLNDESIGDSGDLLFRAPEVIVEDSQIFAFANNGFNGGAVEINARNEGNDLTNDPIIAKAHVINSHLKGRQANVISIAFASKNLYSDNIFANVKAETIIKNGSIIDSIDTMNLISLAETSIDIVNNQILEMTNFKSHVSAKVHIQDDSELITTDTGMGIISDARNIVFAQLSNTDSAIYEDMTSVLSNVSTESYSLIDKDVNVQLESDIELASRAETIVDISLVHEKLSENLASGAFVISEIDSKAHALTAADIDILGMVVEGGSLIQSNVQAQTVFPEAIESLAISENEVDDLAYTVTTAVSKHKNVGKAGFIDDAEVNLNFLLLLSLAIDETQLTVDPGATDIEGKVKGIVDGDFHSESEIYFQQMADVTVNEIFQLEIYNQAPESIDGLSKLTRRELTKELGPNAMYTKLFNMQKDQFSSSYSSFNYFETSESSSDSSSSSESDSSSSSTSTSESSSTSDSSSTSTSDSTFDSSYEFTESSSSSEE